MRVSSDFPSGQQGDVTYTDTFKATLRLKEDPGHEPWRKTRIWFYVCLRELTPGEEVELTVCNHSFSPYKDPYRPVFSYDQVTWSPFSEKEVSVTATDQDRLVITFNAREERIFIAHAHPYTGRDLESLMERLLETDRGTSHIKKALHPLTRHAGDPEVGYALPFLKIEAPGEVKYPVWLHARVHPSETPSSYVMKGFLEALVRDSVEDKGLARQLRVYVAPLVNIRGVERGFSRHTPEGGRLDRSYIPDPLGGEGLSQDGVPEECRILNGYMRELLHTPAPKGAPHVALNLHATHAPDHERGGLAMLHFGEGETFTPAQRKLYKEQNAFMQSVRQNAESPAYVLPSESTGAEFLDEFFPEKWWWSVAGPRVTALTVETTYGRRHGSQEWMSPEDYGALGRSLVRGLYEYITASSP